MESIARAEPVRLFLVGLSEGFARSVARYVGGDPRVALIGVVPSLALAGILLPTIRPDVALLDWAVLKGAARDTIQAQRLESPGLRIICVASESEPYRAAASQTGIDAVISKDGFAGEIESLLHGFFPERFRVSPT